MKPRSPQLFQSPELKPISKLQHGLDIDPTNTNKQNFQPPLNLLRSAARKAAVVCRAILFWQGRASSSAPKPDPSPISSPLNYICINNSPGSRKTKSSKVKSSTVFAKEEVNTATISMEDICKATSNFSKANVIGEGGFGTVYKGKLRNGTIVAIKRVKKNGSDKYLSMEFKNEVLALSKIEHLNLVRLYGCVEHGDEQIIVVEYVGNGTLREHLDGTRETELEMSERLDVAIDVAHAITYLHMYNDPPIIHRDIKASNILITERLRAKVADFGFARLAAEDPNVTHISTQIKGTAGYLDPEYLMTYQLTKKSDVYSFGVLLVELMTGRHPIEMGRPLNERVSARWAMQRLKKGDVASAMDPRLQRSPASDMAVERVLKLAQQCLEPLRQSRPTMKKCAEVLWGIRKDFREMDAPPSP